MSIKLKDLLKEQDIGYFDSLSELKRGLKEFIKSKKIQLKKRIINISELQRIEQVSVKILEMCSKFKYPKDIRVRYNLEITDTDGLQLYIGFNRSDVSSKYSEEIQKEKQMYRYGFSLEEFVQECILKSVKKSQISYVPFAGYSQQSGYVYIGFGFKYN